MDKATPTRPLAAGDPTRTDYIRHDTVEVASSKLSELAQRVRQKVRSKIRT